MKTFLSDRTLGLDEQEHRVDLALAEIFADAGK